jgi:hypothetical protein
MSKKNKHGSQFPKPNSPSTPAVTPAPVATVPNPRQPRSEAMLFDPRTIGTPVYERLSELRTRTNDQAKLRKQKSMAQEIYTYLSTWGLMRLKAEETILKDGREDPVRIFFECLQELSGKPDLSLKHLKGLSADEYLGLTGLALEIAREFSFWVSAIYHDVSPEDNP